MTAGDNIADALDVLRSLGMPRGQLNERSALCLLALIDMREGMPWREASDPLMGITPIMAFCNRHYGRDYAPNTREPFRRQSVHQFLQAGIVQKNPDDLSRPINSPNTVYQITPEALKLLRSYGSGAWQTRLNAFLENQPSLRDRYAWERDQRMVPVSVCDGKPFSLSPGEHSELMKSIIDEFCPRFAPGSRVIYVGDTGAKLGFFDRELARSLGIVVDTHGKFPDVMIYDESREWLFLVESVTSHGPVDPKRHLELMELFSDVSVLLVFVTAFRTMAMMARFVSQIAWETEVWVAESPSHLVHFDGIRFLGSS